MSLTSAGQTTGGAGNDHILSVENLDGSMLGDTLDGNLIANHINGLEGNDRIQGFVGADTLRGAGGNDTVFGGDDNDTIFGGLGQDSLDGRTGADRFVLNTAAETGIGFEADIIDGFNAAEGDRIDLSAIDANAVGGGANDAFDFIGGGNFLAAGQLRATVTRGIGIVSGDLNGDGTADFSITVLDVSSFSASHFFL